MLHSLRIRRGSPARLTDGGWHRYFFETTIRVHWAGEGAPYTGLKPAGLGRGPVIPDADPGIDGGLATHVRDEVQRQAILASAHAAHGGHEHDQTARCC